MTTYAHVWSMLLMTALVPGCAIAQKGGILRAYDHYDKQEYIMALRALYSAEHRATPSPQLKAEIYFLRASILQSMGRSDEARGMYKYIAENFPESNYGYAAREKLNHLPQVPEQVTLGSTTTTTAASKASVNAWSKKPAQVERPDVKPGDTWSYVRTDAPRIGQMTIQTVVTVNDKEIIVQSTEKSGPGSAGVVCDRDWNPMTIGSITYSPFLTSFSFPLKEGKAWEQDASMTFSEQGITGQVHSKAKVIGWEQVTVPAGRFDALKVEVERAYTGLDKVGAPSATTDTFWYVPNVKKAVKFTLEQFREGRLLHTNRLELVEYKVN